MACNIGLSESEFWDMLPREFYRRVESFFERVQAEQDSAWSQTLMIVNHIRGAVGKKGITLEDLKRRSRIGGDAPSKAEFEADLRRIQEARAKAKA